MYVGLALVAAGVWLGLASAPPLALALGYVLILRHVFIRHEEASLKRAFGDDPALVRYFEEVPRWW